MPRFQGFSKDALGFLKALGFHQNREWFQENKALYEDEVKAPMLALLEELSERFAEAGIPLRGDKRSMFRINRDVRFSKDKRPYQTHVSAVLTPSGAKDDPGFIYVHVTSPDIESFGGMAGSFVAAGFHHPDNATLAALRNSIRKDPKGFQAMEAKLKKAKLALETDSQLTRVPRGFEEMKGSAVEGAVRLKDFVVEEPLSEATVKSRRLVGAVEKFTGRAMPLIEWGWKAVG